MKAMFLGSNEINIIRIGVGVSWVWVSWVFLVFCLFFSFVWGIFGTALIMLQKTKQDILLLLK